MIGNPIQYCKLFEQGVEIEHVRNGDRVREIHFLVDGRKTVMLMTMALPTPIIQKVNMVFFVQGVFLCHVEYGLNYTVTTKDCCSSALDTLKYYTERDAFVSYNMKLLTTHAEAEHIFMLALMSV